MIIKVQSETNASVVYRVHVNAAGVADGCSCPSRTYRSHVACKHMLGVDAQQSQVAYLSRRARYQVAPVSVALMDAIHATVAQGPTHRPTAAQIAGLRAIVDNIAADPWSDVEREVLGGLLGLLDHDAGALAAA